MNLHNFYAVVCAFCSAQLIGISAYPVLTIPRWHGGSNIDSRYKKSDLGFPQTPDADVFELEHLKRNHADDGNTGLSHHSTPPLQQQHKLPERHPAVIGDGVAFAGAEEAPINQADLLPELERQLESAAASVVNAKAAATGAELPSAAVITAAPEIEAGQPEQEQQQLSGDGVHGLGLGQGGHRPPMLPYNDGGKTPSNGNQQQTLEETGGVGSQASPSMAKPFYGAARLAFGQNPEVLPTTTSTSTSSTTTTTTTISSSTSATPSTLPAANEEAIEVATEVIPQTDPITPELLATHGPEHLVIGAAAVAGSGPVHPVPANPLTEQTEATTADALGLKEIVVDIPADISEVGMTAMRRSVASPMAPKIAESLLRNRNGQYSSFDMAQYVFWTGDEAGVARAVEEFIEQGLMTRENALQFLRDIRLGIEYLQRSYASRVFPEIRQNNVKKSFVPPAPTTTSTTTTTTTTTTEKPFPYVHLEKEQAKNLGSMSIWNRLQELNNDGRQELSDYDETNGRAKIAEFLYTEYTLEEILYKLAKVMFAQSLAHGSDEAQQELQKLTDFLEREGNLGVIPIDLQKKVLHVLLTALSDTLSEHPELLHAARISLSHPYNRLPMHSYGTILN